MRRLLLISLAAAIAAVPALSYAQADGDDHGDDAAKKRKRDQDWGDNQAPLPELRNAGPCPYVKTLYDAARYVELKQGEEAAADVGFTGEIQGISAGCEYKDDQPIRVAMEVLFELGRGPDAQGSSKTYRYWVAVTDRNREVLAKQTFELKADFPAGQDRIFKREEIQNIVIPRASATTSGANFEVLVGFDVTPQMADFNRLGKRFRLNAGAAVAQESAPAKR